MQRNMWKSLLPSIRILWMFQDKGKLGPQQIYS
jgi:hypothetical protein